MGSRDKKRHRLEKALANSAAIILELEKKKQKKKEEQERLDEEGASISEAVAPHVLTGEYSDESRHLALNKHRRCNERRVLSPRSAGPKKQAEKKRRLLEKALATSAAIISELEKKKQKKKEEQERLDEEGASISEVVALHVLIGEDSDESRHLELNKHRRCNERRVLSPRLAGPKKQAEKKRRLLEKALATSAAIISELEKKKQKKKEEHERLDEEGASISEAVALHVLIDDDSDESRHLVLNKHRRCNDWDPPSAGFDFTLDAQGADDIYSPDGLMCANQAYASKGRWINLGNAHPLPKGEVRELKASCYQGTFHQSTVACPGFMAAQALSSLQIRED